MLFLHRQGYTYMTEPKLLNQEVNIIVEAYNAEIKEQERQAKKSKRRRAMKR